MTKRKRKLWKWVVLGALAVLTLGNLLPQKLAMPVEGATSRDYHPKSYWAYPWGRSVVHRGVDIFAPKGTPVKASVSGLVLYSGEIPVGGKVVWMLGPKWRIHYYAHLDERLTGWPAWRSRGQPIGRVGDTGNARGKPPHLHYSIGTPIPYVWRWDEEPLGWAKMFFLNPIPWLVEAEVGTGSKTSN